MKKETNVIAKEKRNANVKRKNTRNARLLFILLNTIDAKLI